MKNLETLTISCGDYDLEIWNDDEFFWLPEFIDFIENLQKYCTQVSTIEITNGIASLTNFDVLDKFKNLETLVLKNCKIFYGSGISKPLHIKELHHINERESFLNEDYISQYSQHFPSLEKLVIDQSGDPF